MARGRKFKRTNRRKRIVYRKRRGYVRPRKDPLNQSRVLVKHWYRDYLQQIVQVGNIQDYTWRINSMYDPDYTNSGKNLQPYGRDRYAGMYSYYQVKAFRIEGTIMVQSNYAGAPPGNTTNNGSYVLGTYPTEGGAVAPNTPIYLGEINGSKTGQFQEGRPVRFKQYVNLKNLTGLFGTAFNSGLGSYSGTNPGNPIWTTLRVAPHGAASEDCQIHINYKVTFYVEWSMPKMTYYDDV